MEMAISDDMPLLVNTCEWGRHMKQEFMYMDYVIKKKATMNITRIFDNSVQVKICIMGIKLKPQGRLRQKLIGDLH